MIVDELRSDKPDAGVNGGRLRDGEPYADGLGAGSRNDKPNDDGISAGPRSDKLDADVIIVGAGPAGSTLAALLPSHFSVLLLDSRELTEAPAQGEKACGGLLAPDAQKQLFLLGLSLPPEVLCGPQIFGVISHDFPSGLVRAYQRHYLNIHRPLFDRWLFARAAARPHVTALTGRRVVRVERGALACEVFLADGTCLRPRFLVGADGAHSVVRKHWGTVYDAPQTQVKSLPEFGQACRLLALQRTFRTADAPAAFEVFFDPALTDFYAWSIPKDDTLVVGLAAPWGMPEPRRRMDILAERLARLGRHTGEVLLEESCALLRPGLAGFSGGGIMPGSGRTALIGEAGGFISPSSAEGVSFALETARLLAECLTKHAEPDAMMAAYERKLRSVIFRLRSKWAKFAVLYNPTLRRAAMRLAPSLPVR